MLLVIVKVIVPFTPVMLPLSMALLNQIDLPAGIEVELNPDDIDPLITQLIVETGFTVTSTFCVFVQPITNNVYT